MKKTKKFKENRPENYHVHDSVVGRVALTVSSPSSPSMPLSLDWVSPFAKQARRTS